ncbi:L-2-amino-thiazoline-4-carboxylic acid hydrolase [Vallitalea sp.]|jgi:hypothetical protein|uniref:L-2-amino-thiazoline-4-carboxylic acid hydrolase n=1 Tax=Vallitalea sp. TaxID=1882829 RepID=UPI0025EC3844|nr:L-2-amino-thiazoline-4-carboxylic acid hydrolase [Vallitalea sp.]MCT4686538.1 L-2-amino-thiazoline-4-carboxylic acid hydrolase [Vallitalea sp.]
MNIKQAQKVLKLSNEVIKKNIGKEKMQEFINQTLINYRNIEPYARKYKQNLNKKNFNYGVLGLSMYRTLRDDFRMEQETSVNILTELLKGITAKVIESSRITLFFISKTSKYKFIKKLLEKNMYSLTEPNGWKMKRCKSDAYIAFDICKCGLYDWLVEQGAEEICVAFCETDYVSAKYMKDIKFVRNKTIASGCKVCDFRYYK